MSIKAVFYYNKKNERGLAMVDSKTPDTMNAGTALKIIAERLKK